jgi:hypothetical protein
MSTMSAENNSIKRRKIDGSVSTDACCLTDLPKEALIHVSTFLAAPSRALFAASLDGSSGLSDENISAIFPSNQLLVGSGGPVNFQEISAQLDKAHVQQILLRIEALNQTDILDFGKIPKKYVVQLCDDGIKAILLCVDAVNTVKRLKLTNCIGITGVGLEPLRGSTMIEQIDLSLVGKHQIAKIDPEPPISCELVLPILNSIISQDGCSLIHLQFPKKWQRARGQQFEDFVTRYKQMLTNRGGVRCDYFPFGSECNNALPPQRSEWTNNGWVRREEEWIDTESDCCQRYTCYECLKHYCDECVDEYGHSVLRLCTWCGRRHCDNCERIQICFECEEGKCVNCLETTNCDACEGLMCKNCYENAMKCSECSDRFCTNNQCTDNCLLGCFNMDCGQIFCRNCWDGTRCDDCQRGFCSGCDFEMRGSIKLCEDCNPDAY